MLMEDNFCGIDPFGRVTVVVENTFGFANFNFDLEAWVSMNEKLLKNYVA